MERKGRPSLILIAAVAGAFGCAVLLAPEASAATGDLTPAGCIDDNDTGPETCAGSTDGLASNVAVELSHDGRFLYAGSQVDSAVVGFSRNTTSGGLTPIGCVDDNDMAFDTCASTTNGLLAVRALAISEDGTTLYAAGSEDDALVSFSRDPIAGGLVSTGCIDDNDTGPETCATSIDGLNEIIGLALSPDGTSLLAAGQNDDALVRFDRDAAGALTPAGCFQDNDTGPDTCAGTADGLDGTFSPVVSPDGTSVYVSGAQDDAVAIFNRNPTTRVLTPAGCIDDNDTGPDTCAASTDGLNDALGTALSPDGRSLYVASGGDNAIVTFNRNLNTGALTPAGCIEDNDTGPDACAQSTDGLANARGVAVSPDGRSVYVASPVDSAIVVFSRDTNTGALTPAGCIDDNDTGPDTCAQTSDALADSRDIAISEDGRSLYVASAADSAVAIFDREVPPATVADTDPPETTIAKKPKKRTEKRKAKVKFAADETATFECKLDRKGFKPCESPFKKKVKAGKKHKFLVRARDAAGNVDPTPAKAKWKVLEG